MEGFENRSEYSKWLYHIKALDRAVMAGKVTYAPRLGADPTKCPRPGCGGRVFIEKGAHVCLSCGWRQEHQDEPMKQKAQRNINWHDLSDEEESKTWDSGTTPTKRVSSRLTRRQLASTGAMTRY